MLPKLQLSVFKCNQEAGDGDWNYVLFMDVHGKWHCLGFRNAISSRHGLRNNHKKCRQVTQTRSVVLGGDANDSPWPWGAHGTPQSGNPAPIQSGAQSLAWLEPAEDTRVLRLGHLCLAVVRNMWGEEHWNVWSRLHSQSGCPNRPELWCATLPWRWLFHPM